MADLKVTVSITSGDQKFKAERSIVGDNPQGLSPARMIASVLRGYIDEEVRDGVPSAVPFQIFAQVQEVED